MKRYIIATFIVLSTFLVGLMAGIFGLSRVLDLEDAAVKKALSKNMEPNEDLSSGRLVFPETTMAPKEPVNSSVVEHKTPETTAALVTTRSTGSMPQKRPKPTEVKATEPSLPAMPSSASSSSSVSIGAIIRLILIGVIIVAILLLRRKDYEEKRNFH